MPEASEANGFKQDLLAEPGQPRLLTICTGTTSLKKKKKVFLFVAGAAWDREGDSYTRGVQTFY